MKIEFDPDKNQRNIVERGLSFEQVIDFQWGTAYIWPDLRFDYGEIRLNALGFLGERLHYLTFKPIEGGVRVISFRKANKREVKQYESNQ
ncbi:hypothetical protein A4G20_06045 [Pasteurellaceae bacterium RH1A]|nr:hypothetical protein A4G20_06045 [Pasteurellaceae bacterium RH1A]